jgi:hypothetical protein
MLRRLALILGLFAIALGETRAQDCVDNPMPTKRRLLKNEVAVFSGTVVLSDEASGKARFQVTEKFAGRLGSYVEISEFPAIPSFETGKQYLVFATRCGWSSDKGCLTSPPCSDTRLLKYAPALVAQLRADRAGRPMASVYGVLWDRTGDQIRPLPKVAVRLHDGTESFEAKTDAQGAYAFQQLRRGKYSVSVDLPPNMEIGDFFGSPAEPIELPSRSSLEHDIYAFPTGRIAGRVIGPDDKPLPAASVSLYRADQYRQEAQGMYGFQGVRGRLDEDWKPFQFNHLPPGDYILVFNYLDNVQPSIPFHRTFYPHAAKVEGSQIIHLSAGQQITDADIHVGAAAALRVITVRIVWTGREPDGWLPVSIAAGGRGTQTWAATPNKDDPHAYTLALWQGERYSIQATAHCRTGAAREAKTDTVDVDGSDASISQITLAFPQGWCAGQ